MNSDQTIPPGKWVMTSVVTRDPWCLTFYIGAVPVAQMNFIGKGVLEMSMLDRKPEHFTGTKAVSLAMHRMHLLLRSPPPGGEAE